jgi:hypothetical protein
MDVDTSRRGEASEGGSQTMSQGEPDPRPNAGGQARRASQTRLPSSPERRAEALGVIASKVSAPVAAAPR